jgi:hypothetical protein
MFRTSALLIALTTAIEIVTGSLGTTANSARIEAVGAAQQHDHPVPAELDDVEPTRPRATDTTPLRDDEQALVDWARSRFSEAGLELPAITVRFDASRDLCGNAEGRYQNHDGVHLVTVCTRDSDTFAAQLERRRTLLHEFGHVWDTVNLSDDDRTVLGEMLGTDGWYDQDAVWADRGVERFAETFVFALLDQPVRQLKVGSDCETLVETFATATGSTPLGPGLPLCSQNRRRTAGEPMA